MWASDGQSSGGWLLLVMITGASVASVANSEYSFTHSTAIMFVSMVQAVWRTKFRPWLIKRPKLMERPTRPGLMDRWSMLL